MSIHKITFSVTAIFIVLFIVPVAITKAEWNTWSDSFLKNSMGIFTYMNQVNSPRKGHPRSTLWLADRAILLEDPELALSIIDQIELQENVYALTIKGKALAAKQNYKGAIRAWFQAENLSCLWEAGA